MKQKIEVLKWHLFVMKRDIFLIDKARYNRGGVVLFLKWIFSILIYLSVLLINLNMRLDNLSVIYSSIVITAGISIFFGILIIVKKRLKKEE